MGRFYALGGEHFLAFELGGGRRRPGRRAGRRRPGRGGRTMRDRTAEPAGRALPGYGEDLPAHEVNYEQSIAAPLLDLLLAAASERPDAWCRPGAAPSAAVADRLRGRPARRSDAHVPIRHWDGYWFGALRLWGDMFPHYWSVLSAAIYLAWPDGPAPRGGDQRICGTRGRRSCGPTWPTSTPTGRPAARSSIRAASTGSRRTGPIRWPTTRTGPWSTPSAWA